jgi:hypothetical protein
MSTVPYTPAHKNPSSSHTVTVEADALCGLGRALLSENRDASFEEEPKTQDYRRAPSMAVKETVRAYETRLVSGAKAQAGHWCDLELWTGLLKRAGETQSDEDRRNIMAALNEDANYRPLTAARNQGIDRDTVKELFDAHDEGRDPDLSDHMHGKVLKQIEWMHRNQEDVPVKVFNEFAKLVDGLKDKSGLAALDRRRFKRVGIRTSTYEASRAELAASVAVAGYTRSDGTEVAGHTRAAPSASSSSPASASSSRTTAAAPTVAVAGYTRSDGTEVASHIRAAPSASSAPPAPASSATVQVAGYTKSNGTVVAPYTRAAPSASSASSYSSSSGGVSLSGSSSSSATSGGGTYVSGYTRSNGTAVSGYYRGK